MPPNLEATLIRSRHTWRRGCLIHVSFPSIARAFTALHRLAEQNRLAEYDGARSGRHWIKFAEYPV